MHLRGVIQTIGHSYIHYRTVSDTELCISKLNVYVTNLAL